MPSDGNRQGRIDTALTVVRGLLRLEHTLEHALSLIEADLRDEVERRLERLETTMVTTFRRPNILTGEGGTRDWFTVHDTGTGYYWPRLQSYLLGGTKYSRPQVDSLDHSSNNVLAHLEDPSQNGPDEFLVRGLVLGRVQSGKTANYTALIAKAVDAGYRFVIVLAGVHNSLRQQTQNRLALELGFQGSAGITEPDAGRRWITLTDNTYYGDFQPGTFGPAVLQGNDNVIAIVKKNGTVLSRLLDWLQGRPYDARLPTLVIDDEADNASINTGGNRPTTEHSDEPIRWSDLVDIPSSDIAEGYDDDLNPSTINRRIRKLLDGFRCVSYVAYTATPFANVLIDPDATDRQVGKDLYPEDFIISLPTPDNYIGPQELFGREPVGDEVDWVENLDVVRTVPDYEVGYLASEDPTVTPSLRYALADFVLAAAAKQERLGPAWATMLIHTTYTVDVQNSLGETIREELEALRLAWNFRGSWLSDGLATRSMLEERWRDEFVPQITAYDFRNRRPFADIEPHIDQILNNRINTIVLNSRTDDQLEYSSNGHGTVIAIGGNRLSRGLTLEGLITSFFVRHSRNFDTLLQMGRWFGYRDSYVDLTRLWTTSSLYSHFRHLALVEEELREQIAAYEQQGCTPRDFSPLILTHPDLDVTALNRMGAGQIYVDDNYAGQLVQSVRFDFSDAPCLETNLSATRELITRLGARDSLDPDRRDDKPHWQDVDWSTIVEYLEQFTAHPEANSFHTSKLVEYIRRQVAASSELTTWWVSVRTREGYDSALGTINLGGDVGEVNAISRSRLKADPSSLGVLTSPARATGLERRGEEEIGLTNTQIENARVAFRQGKYQRYGTALRLERAADEGLLCIFPVSPHSGPGRSANRQALEPAGNVPVIGLAIVFPFSTTATANTYIGGPLADPILR